MFWKPGQLQVRPGRLVSGTGPVSGRQQTRNLGAEASTNCCPSPVREREVRGLAPREGWIWGWLMQLPTWNLA